MVTRLEVRQWVRAETLIESAMMVDAAINAIIDQAVRDVSTRFDWPFLADTDTINFIADTQSYSLPTDFQRLVAVVLNGSTVRLEEVSPEQYWSTYGATPAEGNPRFFFLWGNQIYVTPVPTASSGGLTLFYYRQPTLMTDDSHSPEWQSEFHMIVADYVCRHLWHREEDFSKARVYDERYLDGVERMARFYLGRAKDSPMGMGGGFGRRPRNDGFRFPFFP
jgi:hypothetical protein